MLLFSALLLFCATPSVAQKRIVVDKSGKGDFTSVQAAVDAVRAFDPDGSTTIFICDGVYYEKVIVPHHASNIRLLGESRDKTILTHSDHAQINGMGTFRTYTLQICADDVTLENLTVENAAPPVAQAVALHTEGDRIAVINCRLLGNQDTVYTGGKARRLYFCGSYIEGTTDFIFGPATAWFEACEIHCKRNSYITAASTPEDVPYGYIFNRCSITVAEGVHSVYLGRPWRAYAMTVFMNCVLDEGINPLGWDNWRNAENEKTARYAEYNNSGKGSAVKQRVAWAKQLSEKQARAITKQSVLTDFDVSRF